MTTNHDFRFIIKDNYPVVRINLINQHNVTAEKNTDFKKSNAKINFVFVNEHALYISVIQSNVNFLLFSSRTLNGSHGGDRPLLMSKLFIRLFSCLCSYREKNFSDLPLFFSVAVIDPLKIFDLKFVHDCQKIFLDKCTKIKSNLNGANLRSSVNRRNHFLACALLLDKSKQEICLLITAVVSWLIRVIQKIGVFVSGSREQVAGRLSVVNALVVEPFCRTVVCTCENPFLLSASSVLLTLILAEIFLRMFEVRVEMIEFLSRIVGQQHRLVDTLRSIHPATLSFKRKSQSLSCQHAFS